MIKAPPRTDTLVKKFKELIDHESVTDLLDPSDESDKIFVPDGGFLPEPMEKPYWSRIVLLIRENLFVSNEPWDKVIPSFVQVRVDIMPPKNSDYNVELSSQIIHEAVLIRAELKKLDLEYATMVMPLHRVRRPQNCMRTEHGYYTSNSIFKTVLGSYEKV